MQNTFGHVRKDNRCVNVAIRLLLVSLVFVSMSACSPSTSTTPGTIIQRAGRYEFLQANRSVDIHPKDDSALNVVFYATGNFSDPATRMSIKSGDTWFAAWDDDGKLWIYSTGTGVRVLYASPDARGSIHPGEFGGWSGVPQPFLEKLPALEQKRHSQAQSHSAETGARS